MKIAIIEECRLRGPLSALWLLCALVPFRASAQQIPTTSVPGTEGAVSFTINQSETYIVFSRLETTGQEKAFEMTQSGGSWSRPTSIEALNTFGGGSSVGGLFLSDDERRLYFHAKVGASAVYDIYRSDRVNGKWTTPVREDQLSHEGDDLYPTVIPGEQMAFLLRHQVLGTDRQERKEADRQTIYSAVRLKDGKWGKVQPINPAISYGFVQDVRFARDGQTMWYTVREDKKALSVPLYTRRSASDSWLLPEVMYQTKGSDVFSPQLTANRLYFIESKSSKARGGFIMSCAVPQAKYLPKPTVTEHGTVVSSTTGKPLQARIDVLDPTTNGVIGKYESHADDGLFHLVNLDKANYQVEMRVDGYSYGSYLLYYDGKGQSMIPSTVALFDTISLGITLFDAEIFRPLEGKVIAVRQSDKAIYRGRQGRPGWFELRLPMGSDYNIIATAKNFEENKFLFKLEGDITFGHYERELSLTAMRRQVNVRVHEMQSGETVASDVMFTNKTREEVIMKPAGETQVKLREGDRYEVQVLPPRGYGFKIVDFNLLKDPSTNLDIEVLGLKPGASLKLNNVLFETASAFLMPESYEELDRLVKMIKDNPDLVVEIAAHTDNVGNEKYNLSLSDQRAASVLEYLVDNGVNPSRTRSKGYGFAKPVANNNTEEGRALNRRVEFWVVGTDK